MLVKFTINRKLIVINVKIQMKTKLFLISIILYSAILLKLVVFKYPPGVSFIFGDANLVPFKTILEYLSGEPNRGVTVRNLLGNIIVLIPFGFQFAAMYQKLKWSRALLIGIVAGGVLEILQVIFKSGIFDVDDIVLNAFGVVLGYVLYKYFRYVFKRNYKKD